MRQGEGQDIGPWSIVPYGDGDCLVIHSDSRNRVCFMATPGASAASRRTVRRNAQLISALPELLAAAKLAIPTGVCLTNKNIPDSTIVPLDVTMGDLRQIAAAVAKATGDA